MFVKFRKIITTGGRNDEIDQTFANKIANFTKKTKEFPNVLIVFEKMSVAWHKTKMKWKTEQGNHVSESHYTFSCVFSKNTKHS